VHYSKLLKKIAGIDHGFGTREGLPATCQPWLVKQIHSDHIFELATEGAIPQAHSVEADALLTQRAKVAIGIQTADCVPILLCDPKQRCVAAVHAGWRGTAHHIVTKVVQRMVAQRGSTASHVYAAIGPCIHAENYEVDEPVLLEMEKTYPITSDVMQPKGGGKYWLNLVAANRRSLLEAGISADHIDVLDYCTFEREDLFFSYRRSGPTAGRNISWIELV